MGFRIITPDEAFSVAPKKAKPKKRGTYMAFIKSLPCIISGHRPVDVAHVSFAAPEYGAFGRGKQQKADDSWTLPVRPDLHSLQHNGNEAAFWKAHGINPHIACMVLWGIWNRMDEPTEHATRLIMSRTLGRK